MASQLVEILKDPLSDVVRKKRRMLLGVSLLSTLIVKAGLIPKRIPALGIEWEGINQNAFLSVMAVVVVYFIVAFVIYGLADFFAWILAYNSSSPRPQTEENIQLWQSIIDNNNDGEELSKRSWLRVLPSRHAHSLSKWRIFFEFPLPVVFGLYAVLLLLFAIK